MGGDACVRGSWPSAGAAAPRVTPPANVAPLFRRSRRLKRFEPIGLSFADEPKRKPLTRSRKYTPSGPSCEVGPLGPFIGAIRCLGDEALDQAHEARDEGEGCQADEEKRTGELLEAMAHRGGEERHPVARVSRQRARVGRRPSWMSFGVISAAVELPT